AVEIAALTRDADTDGLKDWEEAIFRSDPHNPDTDADGTNDGDEIKQNRDPLVPGPHDAMATSTPEFVAWDDAPPGSVNLTGRLAQSLGQQLIAQRLINPEASIDPTAIAKEIAAGATAYQPTAPPLTIKDIIVVKDQSPAAITAWAKQVEAILHNAFRDNTQDEISLTLHAIQKDDYTALVVIDAYIAAYDTAITRIKKISVPQLFVGEQLRLLGLLVQFMDIAHRLRMAEEDPVTAMASIKPYFTLADQTQTLNKEIRKKMAEQNIAF
ncbi:MAG: hypothetical protein AAB916_03190, partial [Patescibacteria group bacterium]